MDAKTHSSKMTIICVPEQKLYFRVKIQGFEGKKWVDQE
jgi:hypothetical protein